MMLFATESIAVGLCSPSARRSMFRNDRNANEGRYKKTTLSEREKVRGKGHGSNRMARPGKPAGNERIGSRGGEPRTFDQPDILEKQGARVLVREEIGSRLAVRLPQRPGQLALTAMRRGLAASTFGKWTVITPSFISAVILSAAICSVTRNTR
jgi:hypothetical protein